MSRRCTYAGVFSRTAGQRLSDKSSTQLQANTRYLFIPAFIFPPDMPILSRGGDCSLTILSLPRPNVFRVTSIFLVHFHFIHILEVPYDY